jgi:hypothetical protein
MVKMLVQSLPLFQLLQQLKFSCCNFSMVGARSDISEEGLDPLKDVECLSVLGSGVGICEVGVIGGL